MPQRFTAAFAWVSRRPVLGLDKRATGSVPAVPGEGLVQRALHTVTRPARRFVGRAISNTLWPNGYNLPRAWDGLRRDPAALWRAVAYDKPAPWLKSVRGDDTADTVRTDLLRGYFDLPPRYPENFVRHNEKTWSLSDKVPAWLHPRQYSTFNAVTANTAFGSTADRWDFDLHADEPKPWQSGVSAARALAGVMGRPVTVTWPKEPRPAYDPRTLQPWNQRSEDMFIGDRLGQIARAQPKLALQPGEGK